MTTLKRLRVPTQEAIKTTHADAYSSSGQSPPNARRITLLQSAAVLRAEGLTPAAVTDRLVTEARIGRREAAEVVAEAIAVSTDFGRWWAACDDAATVTRRCQARAPSQRKGKFGGRKASAVRLRSIEWFWDRFLPLGALSLLYGPEGDGKSVFTAMLAAQATLGTLPGELEGEPAGVEIVAFEDDAEAVLRPRLEAAGANLDLVTIHDDDEAGALLIVPDDVEELEAAIEDRGSRLVIVDPLPDALREGLKDNNNGDVRKGIVPLHRMAQRLGVAVLGVSHPNKGATDPANKVMGSKAWRSVPRSVILYGRDPDDVEGTTRIAAVSKANYSDKPACKVRISSAEVDGVKGTVPRAEVVGASNYRDADLLVVNATGAHGETKGLSKEKRAEHLLYRLLEEGGGEVEARVAYAAGDAVEIGEATVRRARQEIGAEGGKVWRLPDRLPV